MIYQWLGSKADKLSQLLCSDVKDIIANIFNRPEFAHSKLCRQYSEPFLFKTLFYDWDDSSLDRSKASTSKGRRRKLWPMPTPPKYDVEYDVLALFAYKKWEDNEYYDALRADCNFECVNADKFEHVFKLMHGSFVPVFDKFAPLYETEIRIFLVDYRVVEISCEKEQIERVAYVWQGRKASRMDWLTFSMGAKNTFIDLFMTKVDLENQGAQAQLKRKLQNYVKSVVQYCHGWSAEDLTFHLAASILLEDEFNEYKMVRIRQQREPERFLCHFKYRMVLLRGAPSESPAARLFKYGQQSNIINTRTLEVQLSSRSLNSNYCYFLVLQRENCDHSSASQGVIYLWIGKHVGKTQFQDAYDQLLYAFPEQYKVRIAYEGHEHPEFWGRIGESCLLEKRPEYERDRYDHFCRLFRCSSSSGLFKVTELSTDFCQDDLCDTDCFLLDTQLRLYLWKGRQCSEFTRKLALLAAKAYLKDKRRSTLELEVLNSGSEPQAFTRYFFSWNYNE
jgi:hypothetical protein